MSTGSDLSEPPLSSTPTNITITPLSCVDCVVSPAVSPSRRLCQCSQWLDTSQSPQKTAVLISAPPWPWPRPGRYSGKLHKFNEDPLLKDSISRIVSTGLYRTRDLSQLTHDSAPGRVRVSSSSSLEMTHPHLSRYSLPPVTQIQMWMGNGKSILDWTLFWF